jgi:SAM-dependent methyltransferase
MLVLEGISAFQRMRLSRLAHRKRDCPICGAGKSRLLFSQRFEQLSGAYLLRGYDVVICQQCGAGFADRIPPQRAFDQYYRDLSKYEYEHSGGMPPAQDQLRSRQIAATIVKYIPRPTSRILEVGCANGVLLAALRDEGFSNVSGVDPSPGCARAARDLLGIPAQTHSIFDIPTGERVDFLILVGVLEHIRDLDGAVRKIRELLAPRGRVYLAVPDAACFPSEKDAPFQEFSVEHVNFFSTTSLKNLMQPRGFSSIGQGRLWLEPSYATKCVAVFCVFENSPLEKPSLLIDRETEAGLTEYIHQGRTLDAGVHDILANLVHSGRKVLVWGTGAHTLRLLADGGLDRVKISGFVDSNPKYQGQQLHGREILAPKDLYSRSEPILISSYAAQKAIEEEIRNHLGLANEVITLYEM